MYLMITAYDVLDTLHIRVRVVDQPEQDEILTVTYASAQTIPWPKELHGPRDLVAFVGEHAIDVAHDDNPLWPTGEHR